MNRSVLLLLLIAGFFSCTSTHQSGVATSEEIIYTPDTSKIPNDQFGEMVRYGRELMLNTAYYIGPDGTAGHYLHNKMNCTNCHQDAGTKPFSLNLLKSHQAYPQYRARENKVISLAERVNNCIMRPHSGVPLPLDSREMLAFLSYLKWINQSLPDSVRGLHNLSIQFPQRGADPAKGELLYMKHCQRCHAGNGQGTWKADSTGYTYPPLWGELAYQPGSSMHRVIMQAKWLKGNMPYDLAKWDKPVLSDEECLDVAAFINNDEIHYRPNPKTWDYANIFIPLTKLLL